MASISKSNQEQAVAAWINYLNQLRIDTMLENLRVQDLSFENATEKLEWALDEAHKLIQSNRGGETGIHGFIAEVTEVGIHNANRIIEGQTPNMKWIDDNSVADLKRGATFIQQKFYESDGLFSLGAVVKHMNKYPDFIVNGGKYQIPKDQYESVKLLYKMTEKEAYKTLSSSSNGPTIKQWRKIHGLFEDSSIDFKDLEPAEIKYSEVQKGAIDNTIAKEKNRIKDINEEKKEEIHNKSKPNLNEGIKATGVSAAIEGTMAFATKIIEKRKSGVALKDFTAEDWKSIGVDTTKGTIKGGVRGASIYTMTNYTATPAAVASSIVTASFGVAEQAHLLRNGNISEVEFIENAEILCLDSSISALSSFVGQMVIPVPVIGAVIGNTIGTTLYKIGKSNLSKKEQSLIYEYIEHQNNLNQELANKYGKYILNLRVEISEYMDLLEEAFSPDVQIAFEGSITLANDMGVPFGEILDTREKIEDYFMN